MHRVLSSIQKTAIDLLREFIIRQEDAATNAWQEFPEIGKFSPIIRPFPFFRFSIITGNQSFRIENPAGTDMDIYQMLNEAYEKART